MNISSLNLVEKLLLYNTKAYKDFVKNISNRKEIKANSEQEKKFLEVYYNRELKKGNPDNFLFSARTLNEKKQTTQINNFLNGSETELFLKSIDFNNKAYLFKDIKYQNEIIISNPVLVSGILKQLDDYKKEHGINDPMDRAQDLEAEAKKLEIAITSNIKSGIIPIEKINENFFIIEDLHITPEQRDPENEWEDPEELTEEQLSKIPDVLHGFELMYSHKRDLVLGDLEFRRNGVFFSIEPDKRILMTYMDEETSTHKKFLTVNDVKFINQKTETEKSKQPLDKIPAGPDLFENIPEELKTVYDKWQKRNGSFDYSDCVNFQKECEDLGYTFDYGLDAEPFNLRPIYLEKQIQQDHIINNQNTKIMTTQNTDFNQVQYLKDQLKYLQFGEGEKLHKDLETGINAAERHFQIKTSLDKTLPGNTVEFTLNYNKSEKGGIFLNSYIAELKNKKGEELSHIFNISKENTFDAKEAINLLEGRSVKIEFMNPKIEEKQTAFVKLDFNESKTEYGTYKFQSFYENYGVNTAEIVDKSNLIFDKSEWKDNTIKSLERGNIVNVKFKYEDKEIEGKAFLNPQYKTLNLYDSNMTRVNTNKPLEGMGNDNAHDKNNVREQNRSRSI